MPSRMLLCAALVALINVPVFAGAQPASITRRDGFLLFWQSIHRAAEDSREPPFTDVPNGVEGFAEITYAKYRGIIDDDEETFRPDEPLLLEDALLWLFRTRSVDDLSALKKENLSDLLERYPLPGVQFSSRFEGPPRVVGRSVTEEELLSWMRILDDFLLHEEHEVSLYGEEFHGKGTAFGETFDMHALTAAHRTFPYNTLVKVTNIANGKFVTVRINDRGPYIEGRDMDLSIAGFTAIEDRSRGILRATFQRLGDATLVDRCGDADVRRAVRIAKGVHLIRGIPLTMPLGNNLLFRSTRPFVLRSIRYPDGSVASLEDWILPGESHSFTPSVEGEYFFTLGSREGRKREIKMTVVHC